MKPITFPLILSGPMIRRAAPHQVFIWIATSRPSEIHASLYTIESPLETSALPIHSEKETVRLGKQLFVHLIKITPHSGIFPTDTLLGYNLHFKTDTAQHDLESLGLLTPDHPQSIVYANLKYPSFFIKSSSQNCQILYGSCRKLHGEGDDALAIADIQLEKEYANLEMRPSSLFLMGDQIYADDVADPIIGVISALGQELIGKKEPLEKIEPKLRNEPLKTAINQINGRQFIMENLCQFTSSQAQNHLMEFGEFAVMYLLSWGPQLWETAQSHELFYPFEEADLHFAFSNEAKHINQHKAERKQLINRFKHQQENLISFQQSIYRIRRLLANIPSYMIFDDHDLTDDWNISSVWEKSVSNSPLGRHVIANGLTAYWAFQGWGNEPDSFDSSFISLIESYLTIFNNTALHEKWVQTLWNFHSWHYVAPTHPHAVFLDTRTLREFEVGPIPVKFGKVIEETSSCPKLLSREGWEMVYGKLAKSGWNPETPLIIISAAPVYGMGLIESFLHDYVYPLKVLGIEVQNSLDFEAWKYNGKGFTELLSQIASWNPSKCIILSGDVHSASAVEATISFPDARSLAVSQFTSSPFKNMSFIGVWGFLMKLAISFNSAKRRKEIHRYCDADFNIIQGEEESDPSFYLWSDRLQYQLIGKNSIIELGNNIGLLAFEGTDLRNKFIRNQTG